METADADADHGLCLFSRLLWASSGLCLQPEFPWVIAADHQVSMVPEESSFCALRIFCHVNQSGDDWRFFFKTGSKRGGCSVNTRHCCFDSSGAF